MKSIPKNKSFRRTDLALPLIMIEPLVLHNPHSISIEASIVLMVAGHRHIWYVVVIDVVLIGKTFRLKMP